MNKNTILIGVTSLFFLISVVAAADNEGNWISELTSEEFQNLQTYQMLDSALIETFPSELSEGRDFPESWDWRTMGGLTPIRDQAQCGSCWSFAATGVLEAQLLIDTGVVYDLSEQQQVDCTPGSYGCNGGTTESAWSYLSWEPARLEADYPYEAENGECRARNYPAYIRTTGYDAYSVNSEADIKTALMDYGPVATSMGANDNLKAYTGGCYADDSNTNINHAVIIVGWDDTVCDGGSWIVRNSWGDDFGEAGYFYIRRGDVSLGSYISMVYYELLPAVEFSIAHTSFTDSQGNVPEPGSNGTLDFSITNIGRETAENVTATLTCDSENVTIVNGSESLTNIEAGQDMGINNAFNVEFSNALEPGDVIEFTISVTSTAGESHLPVNMVVGPLFPMYRNDFEGESDEGWTHFANRRDQWSRGIPGEDDFPRFDPVSAYSGTHMWGLKLVKSGNYPAGHETTLSSPVFDISGHSKIILNFKRWLSVEKGIYDQATVKVNDQVVWENSASDDLIDTSWNDVLLDITSFVENDNQLQVSFDLVSDGGLEFGGWNIDDFQVLSAVNEEFQQNFNDLMDLNIGMPDMQMETGDDFLLYFERRNYGPERNVMDYIALEVAGMFWFWPDWTQTVDFRETVVPENSFEIETVLTFPWPEIDGHADGIKFWLASLNSNDNSVFDFDMIEWGW